MIGQRRTAFQDFELKGASVPAGTDLYLSVLSSHRDPVVYADAERFDIERTVARPTVMFGGGMTACMGSGLARIEMQEFFRIVAERFPRIRRLEEPNFTYEGRTVCVPGEEWVSLVG